MGSTETLLIWVEGMTDPKRDARLVAHRHSALKGVVIGREPPKLESAGAMPLYIQLYFTNLVVTDRE